MKASRRTIMQTGLTAAATMGAPAMHGDIPTYDPIWTTANMSAYHGALVYDTLFGIDDPATPLKDVPQPPMVGKCGASDDKLIWTFELRDGLPNCATGCAGTTARR